MVAKESKVQIAVSTQLQMALQNPIWGIRVLSGEIISHILKNKINIYILLTTNAHLGLAWTHTLHSHFGKVMQDRCKMVRLQCECGKSTIWRKIQEYFYIKVLFFVTFMITSMCALCYETDKNRLDEGNKHIVLSDLVRFARYCAKA